MDKLEKGVENRVWQRVRGKEASDMPALRRDNLKGLILTAQENTAALRNLQLQLIGKQWEGLRRLESESTKLTQALRGLGSLRGEIVKLTPLPAPKDQSRRALEKCFHRCRKLWEELDRRCADPEFGMIFALLRDRCAEHSLSYTELLGKLDS